MADSAKDLFDKYVASGYDPKGVYTAHVAFSHWLAPTMGWNRYDSDPIKGLMRACKCAKRHAWLKEIETRNDPEHRELGIKFWVSPAPDTQNK